MNGRRICAHCGVPICRSVLDSGKPHYFQGKSELCTACGETKVDLRKKYGTFPGCDFRTVVELTDLDDLHPF